MKETHLSRNMQLIQSNKHVDVYAINLGGQVTTQPTEDKTRNDAKEWVLCYPEGGKYQNLYLEQLALRALRSPTHAACLNKRTNFFLGLGLTTEDEAWLSRVQDLNAYGESMQELIEKDFRDTDWAGNSYIEIVKLGNDQYQFYHRRPQGFRADKKGRGYWYSGDWTKWNTEPNYYRPILYPSFPNFERVKDIKGNYQKGQRCIAHYKDYDPRSNYYGRPHYVSAINDIDIEYRISKYNLDEFDNGFKADMVMTVFKTIKDQKEFEQAKADIKGQHTGEGKNGGMIIEAVDPIDGKPAVLQRVDRTTDGQFHAEAERAERNIIKAHGLTPSLVGIERSGSLGSNQQIISEFEIFQNTVIEPFHARKIRWYDKLFKKTIGLPTSPLMIPVVPPVSRVNGIDPKQVLTIQEQRQELGYSEEYEGELLKPISNGISNSGASNQ